MPERRHRSPATAPATLIDALRQGGNAAAAAGLLGISPATFHGRVRRAGLNLRRVQHELNRELLADDGVRIEPPPSGDVRLTGDVVQLSLSDYAILRAQATVWQDELTKANKIIESLTRELERLKESKCPESP